MFTHKLTDVVRFPSLDLEGVIDNNEERYQADEKCIFLNNLYYSARFSHIPKI
jgi:hypothetical protein